MSPWPSKRALGGFFQASLSAGLIGTNAKFLVTFFFGLGAWIRLATSTAPSGTLTTRLEFTGIGLGALHQRKSERETYSQEVFVGLLLEILEKVLQMNVHICRIQMPTGYIN